MAKGKSVVYEGIVFGSAYEVARYIQLLKLQESGKISQVKCHPKFLLVPEVEGFTVCKQIFAKKTSLPELYAEFDFSYIEGPRMVIEDVKADGNFYDLEGKWNSSKRGWLLEEAFLIKLKMFLWMKDPREWDFRIPIITKEEVKDARARINKGMGGKVETNRPAIQRTGRKRFKRR